MNLKAPYIVYRNRFNEVKCYHVEVLDIGDTYTRIIERDVGIPKTFKNESIISFETDFEVATQLAKVEQLNYEIVPRPESRKKDSEYRKKYNLDNKLEVCFTGFKKPVKNQMIEMAETSGFFVRKSVSTKLDLLVCGEKAGWAKLATASKMDVAIVHGFDGFQRFILTGEIDE